MTHGRDGFTETVALFFYPPTPTLVWQWSLVMSSLFRRRLTHTFMNIQVPAMVCKYCGKGKISRHYRMCHGSVPCCLLFRKWIEIFNILLVRYISQTRIVCPYYLMNVELKSLRTKTYNLNLTKLKYLKHRKM